MSRPGARAAAPFVLVGGVAVVVVVALVVGSAVASAVVAVVAVAVGVGFAVGTAGRRVGTSDAAVAAALAALPGPAAALDPAGRVAACNDAWAAARHDGSTLLRAGSGDDLLGLLRGSEVDRPLAHGIAQVLAGELLMFELEQAVPDGASWYTVRVVPLPDGGLVLSLHDTTADHAPTPVARAAGTQPSVITPDRSTLQLALGETSTGWLADQLSVLLDDRRPGAVLVLVDVDAVRAVDLTMGVQRGNEMLAQASQRVASSCRGVTLVSPDRDTVATLCEPDRGDDSGEKVARRVLDALSVPMHVGDRDVLPAASVGAAVARADDGGVSLLQKADVALGRARARSGPRYAVFDDAFYAQMLERLDIEEGLHRALELDELLLHYQPIIDLTTNAIVGFEALMRWYRAGVGYVPPVRFIPVAEACGLMPAIGAWSLQHAVAQLDEWQGLLGQPALEMAVNLSSRQLADRSLISRVEHGLSRVDVPPSSLVIEVNESSLVDDPQMALQNVGALKALGVKLAIDDFGTGFSSLSYLRHFRMIDLLKIDQSFIAAAGESPGDEAIVRSMINLAHSLGLRVVAEGVETPQQLTLLRGLDCDFAQGFHLAVPQPAHDAGRLVGLGAMS